ncbi:substrate-binding domain-containing protein [Pararhizobium sp.]|uniref:substrate-binding domain-containing protein n=1 Tax=Pararhizobium sp. TaxID=1977563 RepID=UPI00271CE00C|nr:substrate-binding domain-containing protein [Pararhizobium sp.]MDO9418396.1 substrate-binding domain-containing protein [Pararhizobium sp.]
MSKFVKSIVTASAIFCIGAAAEAKPLNITWVAGNSALQTEHRIREGFAKYLEDNGIKEWNITYLDSAGSAEKVANNIQDAVSRGSDFILVTVADLRASNSALSGAAEANIPVFTADSGWIPGSITDVTTNNWQMSSEVSLELINRMRGKGNLVLLTADGLKPVRERSDTLRAIVREYPDVKIIAEHDINLSNFYQDTMDAVQDMSTRFGTEIDAVWAPWDEPAQAAVTALAAAGLDKVPVSGMDGHQSALDSICKQDSMFIATGRQQFEVWGATLADYINRVGEKGESAESVKTSDIVYFPAKLYTKADCEKSQ